MQVGVRLPDHGGRCILGLGQGSSGLCTSGLSFDLGVAHRGVGIPMSDCLAPSTKRVGEQSPCAALSVNAARTASSAEGVDIIS